MKRSLLFLVILLSLLFTPNEMYAQERNVGRWVKSFVENEDGGIGAAFGMKSDKNRNFEAGIFTDEPSLVNEVVEQFDGVWMGSFCKGCGRKVFCKDRIV